jgi:hypothetical protein
MTNDQDPGWRPSLRMLWWSAIPVVGFLKRVRAQRRETNKLILLRSVFLALVLPLVLLFPVALSFVGPWDGGDEGWLPWAVVPIGIASLAFAVRIHRRQLPATSPGALAGSYRVLFFLGIGFAEIPALCATAVLLLRGSLWIYFVGLPFALVGMWIAAPSRRDIERRQREISATGSNLSLLAALISAS